MNISQKQAVKALDGFVDWHALFPRAKSATGKPDMRKKLTRHAREKIIAAAADFRRLGGAKQFHPVRKSKKRTDLRSVTHTPDIFRGYMSKGEISGIKKNMLDFAISYIHADTRKTFEYSVYGFGEVQDEKMLKDVFSAARKRISENDPPYYSIDNNSDNYIVGDDLDDMETDLLIDYTKYATLADAGGFRPTRSKAQEKRHGKRNAVHPSKWMIGIMVPK